MRLYTIAKLVLFLFINYSCDKQDQGMYLNYNKAEIIKAAPSQNIRNRVREITDPVYAEINTHGFCKKMYVIANENNSQYCIYIIPHNYNDSWGFYKSKINSNGYYEDSINISTNNENEDRVKIRLLFDTPNNKLYYQWIGSTEKDKNFPGGFPNLIKSKVQINKPAPIFTLTDFEGNKYDLSKYKNKFVLLNFWSVNCDQYDLQYLYKLRQEYNHDELVIFGITNDEEIDIVKFNKTHKLNYPITYGSTDIFDMYEVTRTPSYCFIDEKGTVLKKRFHIEKLSEEVKKLIKNK